MRAICDILGTKIGAGSDLLLLKRGFLAAFLIVGVSLVGPVGTASADRVAEGAEIIEMAKAIDINPECVSARVSTVDPKWGVVQAINPNCGLEPDQPNYVVTHDESGWAVEATLRQQVVCGYVIDADLGRDLRFVTVPDNAVGLTLCREPRTTILCNRSSDFSYRTDIVRPRSCYTGGPQDSNATSVNLYRVRWSNWNGKHASGRGKLRGRMGSGPIKARLYAYGRRDVCKGDQRYTRLRVTTRYGRGVIKFPARCDAD